MIEILIYVFLTIVAFSCYYYFIDRPKNARLNKIEIQIPKISAGEKFSMRKAFGSPRRNK